MQAQAEDPRELIATCEEGLQMELTPAQDGAGWQVRIYRQSTDGTNRMVDQWVSRETEQRDAQQIAEYILSGTAEYRLNDEGVEGLIPLAAHHVNEYHEKQGYGGPEEGGGRLVFQRRHLYQVPGNLRHEAGGRRTSPHASGLHRRIKQRGTAPDLGAFRRTEKDIH